MGPWLRAASLGMLVLGGSLVGGVASADPPVAHVVEVAPHAEVMVIHATKCDHKTVDPAIGEAPPSLGYDCLKLLDKKSLQLTQGQGSTMTLPNGRTFELRYNGKADGGKHKVTASISNADKSPGLTKLADINAEPNKPFNVGGFAHQGGVLLLRTKIVP